MSNFEIIRTGDESKVVLGDKLVAADVPALQPVLKQEIGSGCRRIIFDLTKTVSLDSSGIGLLIAAYNSLSTVQGQVCLVNVSRDILELLQSMRLKDRLHATSAK